VSVVSAILATYRWRSD